MSVLFKTSCVYVPSGCQTQDMHQNCFWRTCFGTYGPLRMWGGVAIRVLRSRSSKLLLLTGKHTALGLDAETCGIRDGEQGRGHRGKRPLFPQLLPENSSLGSPRRWLRAQIVRPGHLLSLLHLPHLQNGYENSTCHIGSS